MNNVDDSSEVGAQVRVPPPAVFAGFAALGFALQYGLVPLSFPGPRLAVLATGLIVIALGLALGFSAIALFRQEGQDPTPWKPSPTLVARGIFRYTRNPMYVGFTMVTVGLGLAGGSPWTCLFAIPALLAIHYAAVLPEERYLKARFGESYVAYTRAVGRYL